MRFRVSAEGDGSVPGAPRALTFGASSGLGDSRGCRRLATPAAERGATGLRGRPWPVDSAC